MLCKPPLNPGPTRTPIAKRYPSTIAVIRIAEHEAIGFSRTKDKLDTSAIYKLLKAQGQENDPTSSFIWKNAAPPWV